MKITGVRAWKEDLELSRPYTIAYSTFTHAEIFFVVIETDVGTVGLGSATPVEAITGESVAACGEALEAKNLDWLIGTDPRHLQALSRQVHKAVGHAPAACAAVDMALYDLFAKYLELPLVDVLGRCHDAMPTSVTIGIKSIEDAVEDANEYLGRGFNILKVKAGRSLGEDLERLARIREAVGKNVKIRVDANQGYSEEETLAFFENFDTLDLEFVEQPLYEQDADGMRAFPEDIRSLIAADESLRTEADALSLSHPPPACGIYNIKLMKCGGIRSALGISRIAWAAGVDLMWGCMDESVVSIAAALHAAFACRKTRYLDLDGSLDLVRDLATGGFVIKDGLMHLTDGPGLGVSLTE
jgi:L-alanine-DL-glutamate epimerase-like enolase superfamily enzyme